MHCNIMPLRTGCTTAKALVLMLMFFLLNTQPKILEIPDEVAPDLRDYHAFRSHSAMDFFGEDPHHSILRSINEKFLSTSNSEIMAVEDTISYERPYIFFHARKAGGSTLRADLYRASKLLNLTSYIICENASNGRRIPCDSYNIPGNSRASIFAGHIQWGEQKSLEYQRKLAQKNLDRTSGNTSHHARMQFSCMTNIREPVSRIISCINYRFLRPQFGGRYTNARCLRDVPLPDLYRLLFEEVDSYSNSCLNEPFRILSGLRDEDQINGLGLKADRAGNRALSVLTHLSLDVYENTLNRYLFCLPYVLELPEISSDLFAHKFPSLYAAGAYHMELAANVDKTECGNRTNPTPQQLELLERSATFERVLYDAVVAKLQLAHEELIGDAASVETIVRTKKLSMNNAFHLPSAA